MIDLCTCTYLFADDPPVTHTEIPDTLPVSHSVDWQAAFGFPSNTADTLSNDDDLGQYHLNVLSKFFFSYLFLP